MRPSEFIGAFTAAARQRGAKRGTIALAIFLAASSFTASGNAAIVSVSGTSQSSITSAIASACNGTSPGVVMLPNGSYTVDGPGFHMPSFCTLQAASIGSATINVTNRDYAILLDGNNVTINGIVFNGGGVVTTQGNVKYAQSNVNISNNVFQNITSGKFGLLGSGVWANFTIKNNRFSNITSIAYTSWGPGAATIVDDGLYSGGGISNQNGLDQTTIQSNTFEHIIGDAIQISFNWSSGGQAGIYRSAANNDISYNTFTGLHRMAIEIQGAAGGCPGGCVPNQVVNTSIKGNFTHGQIDPYWNSMGYSLVIDGAKGSQFLNNTAVSDASTGCGGQSDAMENSGDGQLSQGNVLSSSSGACGGGKGWSSFFSTASITPGYSITHQNNLLCGGSTFGLYFEYEGLNKQSGHSTYGSSIEQYNATLANCPNPGSPSTSTLMMAFTSGNNQTLTPGGNGTWGVSVTDGISVRNVQFFLDGSSTPSVTQELQDLNTNFANDQKWLYHATLKTTALSNGTHTITAVATDVSGANKSITQSFTVGSSTPAIAAVTVTPASLTFGSQQMNASTAAQTITLTNTGTASLNVANIQLTGANPSDFSNSSTCGPTLAVAASCAVQIAFAPTAPGSRNANVTIMDDAAGSTQSVAVSGLAIAPPSQPIPTQPIPTQPIPTQPLPTPVAASAETLPRNLPTGMALWLANNAGVVMNGTGLSAWEDQSGNGNHALQANSTNQPTLIPANGGQNALHFDGSSTFLSIASLPINGSNGMTVFLVSASATDPAAKYGTNALLFWPETSYWGSTFFGSYETSAHFRFGTTQTGNEQSYSMPFTRTNSFGLSEWEHSGAIDSMWFNAQNVATVTGVLPQINGVGNSALLGKGLNDTFYSGDISEAIVYTRALSAAERATIEQYLMKKYHL